VAVYFLDTSAVVKRYVLEIGSAWIRAIAAPAAGHTFYIAPITDVEFTAAIARRRLGSSLTPAAASAALNQFRQDSAQDYRIAEITIPLLQEASQLADAHSLRAYDAVQLAAALEIRSQAPALVLVSADIDLNAAATAEGMTVDDPNAHP
jgi:predicted nucleic acid-binding protein